MRAARATPWLSSSLTHACANCAGSSGGRVHAKASTICSAGRPERAPIASKNRHEKKRTCASATAKSPQGVCIGFDPVGDPGRERELRQPRDIVHPQLLHHGFAVAAYGLETEIQQH